MFCSKCGANVTDGATFCSACGQPISAVAPLGAAPARPAPGLPAPYAPPALAPLLPSPYAGFWLRVVAHLIDDLLLSIGFGILALIGVAIVGISSLRTMSAGMNGEDPQIPAGIISAIILLGIVSMALGWIVTDLQGRPIGFGHASGRYFAKIITGLIPLGIGYAMAGFTEKKQALHDMIASCLVLRRT